MSLPKKQLNWKREAWFWGSLFGIGFNVAIFEHSLTHHIFDYRLYLTIGAIVGLILVMIDVRKNKRFNL